MHSLAAMSATKVGLSDVGYFDNLLHHDPAIRKKKHDFMLRTFDAAATCPSTDGTPAWKLGRSGYSRICGPLS